MIGQFLSLKVIEDFLLSKFSYMQTEQIMIWTALALLTLFLCTMGYLIAKAFKAAWKKKLLQKIKRLGVDLLPKDKLPKGLQNQINLIQIMRTCIEFKESGQDISYIDIYGLSNNEFNHVFREALINYPDDKKAVRVLNILANRGRYSYWTNSICYESGLRSGFNSGDSLDFAGVVGSSLSLLSDTDLLQEIDLLSIKKIKPIPLKEKAKLKILYQTEKGSLNEIILFAHASCERTVFNNGNDRIDWDNSNAIALMDKFRQDLMSFQEAALETNAGASIELNDSLELPLIKKQMNSLIKQATSPKEALTDIHGLFESVIKQVLILKPPMENITFAELLQHASQQGLIQNIAEMDKARKMRNKRSHNGHEVSNSDCLNAAKTYKKELLFILSELDSRKQEQGSTHDWQLELL